MNFIKNTTLYILLCMILISGNGVVLYQCLCSSKTEMPAETSCLNLSGQPEKCGDCCCCSAEISSCCSDNANYPKNTGCKYIVRFYKLPVFYSFLEKIKFQISVLDIAFVSHQLLKPRIPAVLYSDESFGPPGKTGTSIYMLHSSFLL